MTASPPVIPGTTESRHTARTALGTHATRAAFWNSVLLPANLGSHLLAQLVLANALPRAEFGVYVLALSVAVTAGSLIDLGTERSVVKFLPEVAGREGRAGVRRLIAWVFGVKMSVLLPIILLATLFQQRFFQYLNRSIPAIPAEKINDAVAIAEHDRLVALVQAQQWAIFGAVISLVFVGAIYDVAMQSLVATFRNRSWNLISIIVTLLDPLAVAIIALAGGNIARILAGRVAVALAALALAGIVAVLAVRRSADEERQHVTAAERGRPLPVQRFAAYSLLQYGLQVTSFLSSYAFATLILANADEIAGYRIAAGSVREILSALTTPIIGIQVPIFARIFTARDEGQLRTAYSLVARFLALVLIPGMIGLAILTPNLYRILYPKYTEFVAVGIVLAVLLFLESCLSTGTTVLLTYERYRPVLLARGVALLALPVMFITAPRYGAMGAALTSGGFAVASALVGTVFANRALPIRYPLVFARRVLAAGGCMAVVVATLGFTVARVPPDAGGGLRRVLWLAATSAVAVIGAVVYLGAFRLFGGIEPEDVRRLRAMRLPGWIVPFVQRLLGGREP